MRQTSKHDDLEEAEWVPAYEQAKQGDKKDAWEVCANEEQRGPPTCTDGAPICLAITRNRPI